jgi:hypothetical protein
MAESENREPVVHEQTLAAIACTSAVEMEVSVKRGLNDTRLAVLGILVSIGLTVGFGVPEPAWAGVLAGGGSFVIACLAIWSEWSCSRLMAFMHWLTRS